MQRSTIAQLNYQIPAAAAVGFCAWIVHYAVGLEAASAIPDVGLILAVVVLSCGAVMWLIDRCVAGLRVQDASWVRSQAVRLVTPCVIAAGVALGLAADAVMAFSRYAAIVSEPVVRVQCTRVTSGAVKVTMQSSEQGGRWCFAALQGSSLGTVFKVDPSVVRSGIETGGRGVLRLRLYPSLVFGAEAYWSAAGVS